MQANESLLANASQWKFVSQAIDSYILIWLH